MTATAAFDAVRDHLRRLETLDGVYGLLEWDEATGMPKKAAPMRGRQMALLAELQHTAVTDPRIEGWLAALAGSDDPLHRACVRNLGRTYARERRVPARLVTELEAAKSAAFAAWLDAKASSDGDAFLPHLERLVGLTRERAAAIDEGRHPYDVLVDEFDPGTTLAVLRPLFARLRDGLAPLLDAIAGATPMPRLEGAFDLDAQGRLSRHIAEALGYDFDAGRIDHAEHPFSAGFGPGDVRITTHLYAEDLLNGLGSTIHETGHALYEQGLPNTTWDGTTAGEAASYGLHESQSRFWENFIGRSAPFSDWLAERMPEAGFGDLPPGFGDRLYRAANRVEPGLVRVAADEVTYNLHIIVRFELEVALLEGTLAVADLPDAWNAKVRDFLGVEVPDAARGFLQDVHWAGAAFGYFPSYTLGNLYAASLGATLEGEMPSLWDDVRAGRFGGVLAFLRDRVHRHGHLLEAPEIMAQAVGERDHVEDLLAHLWGRHGALHGLRRPC
jgi:carboxypeptidase Taq